MISSPSKIAAAQCDDVMTTMTITMTLPEPPSANRYWRHAKGRTYLSAHALAYRGDVARAWVAYCRVNRRIKRLDGPVVITYFWYRGRKAGDLDNRTKQLFDALRGYAYADDSQIVEIHAYRYDRPRNAGLDIIIAPLTGTPDGTLKSPKDRDDAKIQSNVGRYEAKTRCAGCRSA